MDAQGFLCKGWDLNSGVMFDILSLCRLSSLSWFVFCLFSVVCLEFISCISIPLIFPYSWISSCCSPTFCHCHHQDTLSSPSPASSGFRGSFLVPCPMACSLALKPPGPVLLPYLGRVYSPHAHLLQLVRDRASSFFLLPCLWKLARVGGWRAYFLHPCHYIA